jgi:hypothetical protein
MTPEIRNSHRMHAFLKSAFPPSLETRRSRAPGLDEFVFVQEDGSLFRVSEF